MPELIPLLELLELLELLLDGQLPPPLLLPAELLLLEPLELLLDGELPPPPPPDELTALESLELLLDGELPPPPPDELTPLALELEPAEETSPLEPADEPLLSEDTAEEDATDSLLVPLLAEPLLRLSLEALLPAQQRTIACSAFSQIVGGGSSSSVLSTMSRMHSGSCGSCSHWTPVTTRTRRYPNSASRTCLSCPSVSKCSLTVPALPSPGGSRMTGTSSWQPMAPSGTGGDRCQRICSSPPFDIARHLSMFAHPPPALSRVPHRPVRQV